MPVPVKRQDYRPPDYQVEEVRLVFELARERSIVTAELDIKGAGRVVKLDGISLDLRSVAINGEKKAASQYQYNGKILTVTPPAPDFTLTTECAIFPEKNKALEGLFVTGAHLCTQCEPEGFRHITFFPDRPDILARYHVILRASCDEFPTLLSNGNLCATRFLEGGRHEAIFEDPFKKPSYLFALVAGKLGCLKKEFVTLSGRVVTLHLHTEMGKTEKLAHACTALCRAMRWDEEKYGLEYDLDDFHIVAVDDFNMGAMENKGLNIFNTKYVLADPHSASDNDYHNIESIVAHEYFHNWTGNRVTCRDWFQLSLKEGLTVFRDQEFSADLYSRPLKRIQDVIRLRHTQFSEDAGPLAHPVRPDSYMEINNFYTPTVYEKGAELIRMLETFLGKEVFIKGIKAYLKRYDGIAATCDDFLCVMQEQAPKSLKEGSLKHFIRWYEQAGTPELNVTVTHNSDQQKLVLEVSQNIPRREKNPPLPIPFVIKAFDPHTKKPYRLTPDPAYTDRLEQYDTGEEMLLHLTEKTHIFCFSDVAHRPIFSFNRHFSAPVYVKTEEQDDAFLMRYDDDPVTQHDAVQRRATMLLCRKIQKKPFDEKKFIDDWGVLLTSESTDLVFRAALITLPRVGEIIDAIPYADPLRVDAVCKTLHQQIVERHGACLESIYERMAIKKAFAVDPQQQAMRALRNQILVFLSLRDTSLAERHYAEADNVTDRLAALKILALHQVTPPALEDFLQRFGKDRLNFGKWLALHALARGDAALEHIKGLTKHASFSMDNPNDVHALLGTFARENTTIFHNIDGSGYRFLKEMVIALDRSNPQLAARLTLPLSRFKHFNKERCRLMRQELEEIIQQKNLSRNLFDIVSRTLSSG